MMKRLLIIFPLLIALSACSDFLDVASESIIDKDELFKTPGGFMAALNGVYSRCTQVGLYGGELTFGMPDVLAQNFTVESGNPYQPIADFNFKHGSFTSRRDAIWSGLYSAVSDCNLILENIEEHPDVLPEATEKLIKAEALALRAYLHFDLFRLFGTSIAADPLTRNIPYVNSFSTQVTQASPGRDVLGYVIEDLEQARELLRIHDPILKSSYKVGYTTDSNDDADVLPDDGSTEEQSGDLFLQNRRHRMNYFAVCATLARAYLCLGEKSKALTYAEEVIQSNKFPWTGMDDFTAGDPKDKDRILYKELIFAWFIDNNVQVNEVRTRFEEGVGSNGQFVSIVLANSIYEIAGPGAEDLRFKEWFKKTTSVFEVFTLQKYIHHNDEENKHYLMAPAIRLSEMYYIAAECSFNTNPVMAQEYFNVVRRNRGIISDFPQFRSEEDFVNELIKESRKEFFGEGQIFYLYKRLNKAISGQGGNEIPPQDKIFVLPLPDNEIEFGGQG